MSWSKLKNNSVRTLGVVALLLTLSLLNASMLFAAETEQQIQAAKAQAIISSDQPSGKLIEGKTNSMSLKSTVEDQTIPTYKVLGGAAPDLPEILKVDVTSTVKVADYVQIKVTASGIADDLEDHFIGGRFKSPSGHQYKLFQLRYDINENLFVGKIYVDQFTSGGVWMLDYLWVEGSNSYKKLLGTELGNPQFEVNNTTYKGVDIISLEISTTTANLGDTVTVSVDVNDNGMGVEAFYLRLARAGETEEDYSPGKSLNLIYNSKTDQWEGSFTVDDYVADGTWGLLFTEILDSNGIITEYKATDFPDFQLVINNPNNDGKGPQVLSSSVAPSNLDVGDTVILELDAADTEGVSHGGAYFTTADGKGLFFQIRKDPASNFFIGTNIIEEEVAAGTFTLDYLYLTDIYSNEKTYAADKLPQLQFTVNNPKYETIAPIVNSVEVNPQVVSQGELIQISVAAFDQSGIDRIAADFFTSNDDYAWVNFEYNDSTDKWEGTIDSTYVTPGDYTLGQLDVWDIFGNEVDYNSLDLPHVYFTVTVNTPEMTTLILNPSQQELIPGQRFTVSVDVKDVEKLTGAEAKINFDPAQLTVVDVDPDTAGTQIDLSGVVSGITVKNQVVNGEIWFSTAKEGYVQGFFGDGNIATITFEVLADAVPGTSQITFGTTKLTDNSAIPKYIPHNLQDATVNITTTNNGTLEGYVILQGLYNHEGALVWLEGTEISAFTNSDGSFLLENVPAGNYNLVVYRPDRKPVFLTRTVSAYVDENQNAYVGDIFVYTGDINSDNKVGLLDLTQMADAYGYYNGNLQYNYNADLNDNMEVDLVDLVLMAKNWGQQGYTVIE